MAHVPKTPFTGKLLIDATSSSSLIFDLAPGATRSLKREQDGIEGVLIELPTALTQHAKALNVANDAIVQFDVATTNINVLRALLADAEKLVEVLRESVAFHEDAREADFSMLADIVKSAAARKDPAIAAAFEKLLKYVAQVGVKAAATRRKNEVGETNTPATDGSITPSNTPAADASNTPG